MAEAVASDYSGLERIVKDCINTFIAKDQYFAACIAGPVLSLSRNDCFNSTKFYGGGQFFNRDSGICKRFVAQFNCCPQSNDDLMVTQCRNLFQRVFIDSIPLIPLFSLSTWIMLGVFGLILAFLVLLFFLAWRNNLACRQICALLKKNWFLWRHFWIKNMFGYVLPLSLIGILYFVIYRFTARNEIKQVDFEIPFDFRYYSEVETMRITIDSVSSSKITMYQNLRSVVGLFFLVIFIYPISNTISDLVIEKQTRMKETLKLSGVQTWIIVFTDYLTKTIVFTPLALGAAIFTKYGMIFPTQDLGYLFFFFLLYLMAMTSFSYGIAVFFNQSKPAIICGITSILALFMQLYRVLGSKIGEQRIALLSAPVGLGIGLQTMVHEASFGEGIAISYDRYMRETSSNQTLVVELNYITVMFFADMMLYLVIALYLDAVVPQTFGTRKPFYFFLLPKFWIVQGGLKEKISQSTNMKGQDNPDLFEPLTKDQINRMEECKGVRIHELAKKFGSRFAVQGLNAFFYKNEITGLLGSNGAGKSTTFSMLTGMMEPTSGDTYIFGLSLKNNIDALRTNIGFCPQHNSFYESLTVRQNLELFAELKGVDRALKKEQIKNFTKELNIYEKLDQLSRNMSGGQKRKLSIAIALLGTSKFVIFDEPTAGMDPLSRRQAWNVMKQNKKGRVIILTTHFLDEADFLSDRIVIMSKGQAYCSGTPMFLKNKLSHGYQLSFTHKNPNDVLGLIKFILPEAKEAEDVGRQVSKVYLPVSGTSKFGQLLDEIEHLEPPVVGLSLAPPQLEDVFLSVANACHGDFMVKTESSSSSPEQIKRSNVVGSRSPSPIDEEVILNHSRQLLSSGNNPMGMNGLTGKSRKWAGFRHLKALLQKRRFIAKRDLKLWVILFIIPIVFFAVPFWVPEISILNIISPWPGNSNYTRGTDTCIQTLLSLGDSNDEIATKLRPSKFDPDDPYEPSCCDLKYISTLSSNQSILIAGISVRNVSTIVDCISAGIPQCLPISTFSDYMTCTTGTFAYCKYAPWICRSRSCCDILDPSGPYYPCQSHTDFIKRGRANGNTKCPSRLMGYVQIMVTSFIYSITIFAGIIFIPILAGSHVVWEKEDGHNCKFQQFVTGVRPMIYWISNFTWDLATMLAIIAIAAIFVHLYVMLIGSYLGASLLTAWLTLILMFCFAISVLPLTYLLSFVFSEHSKMLTFSALFHLGAGVALGIVAYILRVTNLEIPGSNLRTSDLINKYLRWGLLVFPSYAFVDGIVGIQNDIAERCILKTCPSDKDGNLALLERVFLNLIYMVGVCVLSLILISIIENKSFFLRFFVGKAYPFISPELNDDVAEEKRRLIAEQRVCKDPIQILGLAQKFKNRKVLKDLWYSVKRGECFGYLGVNGSGKTTTMKILTGKELPFAGEASLGGISVFRSSARDIIGYCPQFDALFDFLSVHDHLVLYSRIRGCYSEKFIGFWIQKMNLEDFRDVSAIHLSGGNKRKLSFSIAMIGGPVAAFLDEPSTGLDAYSKRFLWRQIKRTIDETECAVILTTHSIEECEALCPRIGILVDGQLQCLGAVPYIKQRYGSTITMEIYFSPDSNDEIHEKFEVSLQLLVNDSAEIREKCGFRFVYRLNRDVIKLSKLFDWIERHKTLNSIDNYSIGPTGLEDIFNEFAERQQALQAIT